MLGEKVLVGPAQSNIFCRVYGWGAAQNVSKTASLLASSIFTTYAVRDSERFLPLPEAPAAFGALDAVATVYLETQTFFAPLLIILSRGGGGVRPRQKIRRRTTTTLAAQSA